MTKVIIEAPEKEIFTTNLPVRIYDINYGNHVGHDSMLSIFHEARTLFLKQHGLSEIDIFGSSWIMSSLSVLYKSQARYGDTLKISIGIGEITQTSLDLIYLATNLETNKEVSRANTKMIFFDYKNNKIMKIPQNFVQLIQMT